MPMSRGALADAQVFVGHSTNFPRLHKKAPLTSYPEALFVCAETNAPPSSQPTKPIMSNRRLVKAKFMAHILKSHLRENNHPRNFMSCQTLRPVAKQLITIKMGLLEQF